MKKTLMLIVTFLSMAAFADKGDVYQQAGVQAQQTQQNQAAQQQYQQNQSAQQQYQQQQDQTQQTLPYLQQQNPSQQYEQYQQDGQSSANLIIRDYLVGPKYTSRWIVLGEVQAPKIISDRVELQVGGRLVNEILIRALKNPVEIKEASAVLVDGQRVNLYRATGTLREGGIRRIDLDYYYSLRVDYIELEVTSPALFGSRGVLVTHVGLAGNY